MESILVERAPRRSPRKISENVRELHLALSKVLNNDERTFLIQSLNQYQREKNVHSLVLSFKSVLNTPRKREVYPLLWQIIPRNDQEIFHYLWHDGFEASRNRQRTNSKSPARSPAALRRDPNSSSLPNNLHRYASDSGIDLPNMRHFKSSSLDSKYPIRQLTVKRPSNSGFGFYIRGGAEHGVGLYVSSVDEHSVAEKEGLLPGDHIIQVNGTKFDGLTHTEAVKIIRHSKKLHLFVRSVGRVPNSFVAESTCKWVDMRGRRVSPPPGVDSNGRILTSGGIHKSDLRLLGDDDERKVNISVEDGIKLGLMIRGGSDCGLGIYIAGVDPDGAAEQAGLKAGDQILDVNGHSFLNISHKQAVKVLKSAKNMIVTLKDIGRLPFTRVTHDKTKWITGSAKNGQVHRVPEVTHITEVEVHSPPGSSQQVQTRPSDRHHTTTGRMSQPEPSMFHHGIAGSQVLYSGGLPSQKNLVTEQARQILNENELETLKYYLEEYSKGYVSVSAFSLALFDLLNSPAKMSLLTEIRSSVAPRDIDRFDDLVLKKEIEIMKSRQFLGSHLDDDRHSLYSNASSVSSFSGKESSSKSSAKGSLDGTGSRPITPPQVPEILPPNVKVNHDIETDTSQPYEVYEATLTFNDEDEQTFEDDEIVGLPSFLTIDPVSLDLPASENTPVPSPVDISTATSPAVNAQVSPTKTVGEATTCMPVGDNTRKDAHGKEAPLEGHRTTRYTNGEVNSKGLPASPQPGKTTSVGVHQTMEPSTSQSAPNPFIFPSTFQENTSDVDYPTSISAVFESSFAKQSSDTNTPPRELVATQAKPHPQNQGKNGKMTADDEDLRPEVAKLPGSKRVASWGEIQDEPRPLGGETKTLTTANGPPSVEPNTSKNSIGSPSENQREYGGEDNNIIRSVDKRRQGSNSQVSDASSESSSPSHSRRSSVTKNRKSWDGVRNPGESEQNQKVSSLKMQKDNKERSCSDSNLMFPTSHQDENLHQQPKTITIEARDGVESPRHRVKELVGSVFEVEVDKSSSSLGITLEGGSDMGSDIRIKSVKEGNFAAWKCGGLKAGQVVLQVDGTPLTGMTSGMAVLTLRHAYSTSDSPVLKLLIRGV